MTESIEWLRILILNYPSFQYSIIFFATALGGELALFALAFFAAQGVFSLFPLIVFSFLGAFSPNILWFFLGRTATVGRIISHRYTNTTTSIIVQAITRVSRGNHLVAIIITKFIIGTPLILAMYVNKTAITFKKFLYYESVAIFLSLLIVIPIGFISGLGFTYFAQNLNNLYVAFGFVLLIVIMIIIFQVWLEKMFIKKN